MHGQYSYKLGEKLVDMEQSNRWLKCGDIKGETESTIVAAQDQAAKTNCFKNKFVWKKLMVDALHVNYMKLLTT
jgi:hypothetical protein